MNRRTKYLSLGTRIMRGITIPIVESNISVSEESAASSEELASQATVLRKLVNEFKI